MSCEDIVIKEYNLNEDELEQLTNKHTYISEKLMLDLVNGVGVVAQDLNKTSKNKEKSFARVWDAVIGDSKKRQNQINENIIEGLSAATEWLTDHERHLTKIDLKMKVVADELYKTQDEILKFHQQFEEVVECLEKFKESAENRFENIEDRLKRIEAQQQIDIEVNKISHLGLPVEVEIFTILDNLASGEFGLWIYYEKDVKKRDEQISYLQRKIKEKLQNEGKEYINFDRFSEELQNLENLEKKATEFTCKQYLEFSKIELETVDLLDTAISNLPERAIERINSKPHIRTFLTYEDYIQAMTEELLLEA